MLLLGNCCRRLIRRLDRCWDGEQHWSVMIIMGIVVRGRVLSSSMLTRPSFLRVQMLHLFRRWVRRRGRVIRRWRRVIRGRRGLLRRFISRLCRNEDWVLVTLLCLLFKLCERNGLDYFLRFIRGKPGRERRGGG
jgi:hypothetical protein